MKVSWAVKCGAAGCALSLAIGFVPKASADTETIKPSTFGYFTQTQDPFRTAGGQAGSVLCALPSPDPRTCVNPAQVTGGTPGFPRKDNYLYVAQVNGNTDAIGVSDVPLFTLPLGSEITEIKMRFQVENDPEVGTVGFVSTNPGIEVCLATEGFAGQDAGPYDGRPATDCAISSLPKFVSTKGEIITYEVDLAPMAAAWASGRENFGVVFLPEPMAPDTFEAAIQSPAINSTGIVINVTFTPGAGFADEPFTVDETALGESFAFGPSTSDASFGDGAAMVSVGSSGGTPRTSALKSGRDSAPRRARNPWWIFASIPIGLGVLGAMARGVTSPIQETLVERSGPVSRLMNRRTSTGSLT